MVEWVFLMTDEYQKTWQYNKFLCGKAHRIMGSRHYALYNNFWDMVGYSNYIDDYREYIQPEISVKESKSERSYHDD